MGDDSGEVYSPSAGREPEPLNTNCYRITEEDRLGEGSLKQKCRDNFAAIELVRQLDIEGWDATEEQKRTLVKYVGWGGIPQVFAWHGDEAWEAERERLQGLLSAEQYEAARASTLNAHYTAANVITAIYDGVQRLGFTHGRTLEPALGIGHFFGLMPEEMRVRSRLTGVELDPLSASIARRLYPDADIRAQGFEATALVDGSFDLAISNVPFGDYKPFDPQLNDRNFLIHDYFFAKGIEKVRPGGLMVFITSKGTLDKVNSSLRDHLFDKADFLGAIRLPNTAFKQNANTEVTTDIIFLRRLSAGERPGGPAWLNLAEHSTPDGQVFQINEYFVANPHMMLGRMADAGKMYRGNEPTLAPDGRDLTAALREAIAALPQNVYVERQQTSVTRETGDNAILAPDYVKENAFTIHDGMIAIRVGGMLQPVKDLPEETARRVRGMIKVRDAVRHVLRTQIENFDDDAILDARRQLNFTYDYFVSRFGPLNDNANQRAFRGDPDRPLLRVCRTYVCVFLIRPAMAFLFSRRHRVAGKMGSFQRKIAKSDRLLSSLEDYNEETKRAAKTAIFRERTIHQAQPPRVADTAQDALVLSLNETGRVDLEKMESLLSRPPGEFLPELKGLIYRNPQTEQWETDDQYLSGDVRTKLENARAAAAADPSYFENLTALEAVQPADLSATEIDARLGAVWIPTADVKAFAKSLLGSEGITVAHAAAVGTWFLKGDYGARATVANSTEWGTGRYSALELIQDALNLKTPTVYDTDPRTKSSVINAQETEAARDKLEKIKDRFKTWIWEDDERRERLCRKYNDDFNSVRLRAFNGSHLTLPASSQLVSLHSHQKNAVWRVIQSDNTLLAHVVGAGIMPRTGLCRVRHPWPSHESALHAA